MESKRNEKRLEKDTKIWTAYFIPEAQSVELVSNWCRVGRSFRKYFWANLDQSK